MKQAFTETAMRPLKGMLLNSFSLLKIKAEPSLLFNLKYRVLDVIFDDTQYQFQVSDTVWIF